MIKRKDYLTLHNGRDDDSDGTEIEETQYPYFDDNLNLAGYTSKWTERNTGKFFAFIDFSADGSDGEIRYCIHCESFGIKNKLGPKIKKKDEPIAPDDDQFLSCYSCGNTYPIYETHFESQIKDSLEVTENPFEGNESIFLATETRKEQRKKGRKRKGRFSYKQEHQDSDIQREIDKGLAVNILYDSSR